VNAHELTMPDNYVVKTALKVGADWLRPLVEQVVRLRSEVEAHGNLVFTLTLLKRAESKQPITAEFVSQGFLGACMRAVTVRRADQRKPDVVEFTHTHSGATGPARRAADSDAVHDCVPQQQRSDTNIDCACHHLVGRDASAANVIADIFAYQQALPLSASGDAPVCTLPAWITEERTTL
jgi:hypothetical protein